MTTLLPLLLLVSTTAMAQLDPGTSDFPHGPRGPWIPSGPIRIPGGLPGNKGYPSVWEGGTNVDATTDGVTPEYHARATSGRRAGVGQFVQCTGTSVEILVPGGISGALTFVNDDCPSSLAGYEVWTWPVDNAWPKTFEIQAYAPEGQVTDELRSWAFERRPFETANPGPLLRDVSTLPEDLLYRVERIKAGSSQVVAWFWFQVGEEWNQVAFEKASLGDPYLTLLPGESLRFTAVNDSDLPAGTSVLQAGDW